jgi:hypothetical protein
MSPSSPFSKIKLQDSPRASSTQFRYFNNNTNNNDNNNIIRYSDSSNNTIMPVSVRRSSQPSSTSIQPKSESKLKNANSS